MWSAVPDHWFSWDFTVRDAALQLVGGVTVASWRERGAVNASGIEHQVSRQGLLGPFVLEHRGSIMASAEKPSAFRKTLQVEWGSRHFTLKARSVWSRDVALFEGGRTIGSITPDSFFGRRAQVDLPDDLPVVVRLFLIWLTVLLWKRDAVAA